MVIHKSKFVIVPLKHHRCARIVLMCGFRSFAGQKILVVSTVLSHFLGYLDLVGEGWLGTSPLSAFKSNLAKKFLLPETTTTTNSRGLSEKSLWPRHISEYRIFLRLVSQILIYRAPDGKRIRNLVAARTDACPNRTVTPSA